MTSRRPARLPAALALFAVALLAVPGSALGHAELETVRPKDGSTVVGPPAEIVMTFSQSLDPAKSSIRLVNAAGSVVAEGGTVDTGRKTMRLAVPPTLAAGAYTVRWTSFSTEDNEQDRGTTTFTVTAPTPVPTTTPSPVASLSAAPSVASVAPSRSAVAPSPSAPPTAPVASTSDALIPIVAVILAILGLGLWLLRGRSRRAA